MKLISFLLAFCLAVHASANSAYWIDNIRIVDVESEKVSRPMAIHIENDRISAIKKRPKKGDTIIDGEGRFVIPGLIDAHVHLGDIPGYQGDDNQDLVDEAKAQIPRSYLYYGFTTLLDLASGPDTMRDWNSVEISPTAYHCSGVPIASGYPIIWAGEEHQFQHPMAKHMLYEQHRHDIYPDSFDPHTHSAEQIVNAVAKEQALCIKTYFERGFGAQKNLPVPEVQSIKKLIKLAHEKDLKVFLHGNSEESYRFALETKVDAIAHGMWHSQSDAETQRRLAQQIAAAGILTQPTMQVIYGEPELFNAEFFNEESTLAVMPKALIDWYKSDAGQWMTKVMMKAVGVEGAENPYKIARERYTHPIGIVNSMIQNINEAGGQFSFGSDTPSGPIYTQFPGANGHKEIHHLHNAGLSLNKLLATLTIENARFLGIENEIGSIEVGKRADLLLLEINPLESIEAYDSIDSVVVKGKLVARERLKAN